MTIPPPPPIDGNSFGDGTVPQPPPVNISPPVQPPAPIVDEIVVVAPAVYAPARPTVDQFGNPISPKSRLVAALLAGLLGSLGIHRFYVGKIGTGIAIITISVFTLFILGWIWPLIDFITILAGSFRDRDGRRLENWQ